MFLMQYADMTVRGAPLIGATAAFGIYLATLEITPRPISATTSQMQPAI